jgi:hypothetical protein
MYFCIKTLFDNVNIFLNYIYNKHISYFICKIGKEKYYLDLENHGKKYEYHDEYVDKSVYESVDESVNIIFR